MNKHKVTILCTDPAHPVNAWLERWTAEVAPKADVSILRDATQVKGGDFLFLVSCHQIIRRSTRDHFRHSLVLHASPLPHGRGMSPHIWQVLEGATKLTLTLLNAEDEVDSGDIWLQREFEVPPTALYDEINARLFDAEVTLMHWALENCDTARPRAQYGQPTIYRRRRPQDNRIDPERSLGESFDLMRVADPDRYPAFFEFRGQKYRIRIDKL